MHQYDISQCSQIILISFFPLYTYLSILASICLVGFFQFSFSHIRQEGFGSVFPFPVPELLGIRRVVTLRPSLSSSRSRWMRWLFSGYINQGNLIKNASIFPIWTHFTRERISCFFFWHQAGVSEQRPSLSSCGIVGDQESGHSQQQPKQVEEVQWRGCWSRLRSEKISN